MPTFREAIVCPAAPADVWRLVHDPERLTEWMTDTARVEPGEDGTVTRYMHGWPDFPMPTRVQSRADGARVVISCLVSDIDFRIALAPDPGGCAVEIEVSIPEDEAARAEGVRAVVAASLERLAVRVAAPGGRLGHAESVDLAALSPPHPRSTTDSG